jgi:hypothetical protein
MTNPQSQPLQLYQPFHILVIFSLYSPILLATFITSTSFLFQNVKGFIYLSYLLACCLLRNYIYYINGAMAVQSNDTICNSVQYSKYGNANFSAFVFAFSIMYLSLPMFANNSPNYWLFTVLLIYFFADTFIKYSKGCILNISDFIINTLFGAISASGIIAVMYMGGSSKYLFFNEVSSDKDVCYKPTNQTFKCAVYKNGELVGSI